MSLLVGDPWGNVTYNMEDAPRIGALLREQEELKARVRSLEDRLYAGLEHENFLSERAQSPHLSSSGRSGDMSKKARQEHYKRKGSLETKKEAARRNIHHRKSSGTFRNLEEKRKTYKQLVRNIRKTVKATAKARKH